MAEKLFVARHCVTEANIKYQLAGSTDLPLNKKGHKQAEDMAKRINTSAVDAVFSSPMKRTLQTAKACFPGRGIETINDFREVDFGDWECLTVDQVKERDYEGYERWLNLDREFSFPQGEDMESFISRISIAAESLRERPEKNIMLFSHAGTLKYVLCHYLGFALADVRKFNIEHGKISSLELFDGGAALSGLNMDSI